MFTHVILHYGEIGTKKGNRLFFEKALARNIRRKLSGETLKRGYGRFVIELQPSSDKNNIEKALSSTFGIANFAFAVHAALNLDDIIAKSVTLAKQSDAQTFRISANRVNKNFPLTSMQVNEVVGGAVMDLGKQVDLKNPELDINIEIANRAAYIYSDVQQGLGGLPVGSAGKVIALVYKHPLTHKKEMLIGVLADTGGAFINNLYQLDLFGGVFKNKSALTHHLKQFPPFTRAMMLCKR